MKEKYFVKSGLKNCYGVLLCIKTLVGHVPCLKRDVGWRACAYYTHTQQNVTSSLLDLARMTALTGWACYVALVTVFIAISSGEKKLNHPAFTGMKSQSLVLKVLYW